MSQQFGTMGQSAQTNPYVRPLATGTDTQSLMQTGTQNLTQNTGGFSMFGDVLGSLGGWLGENASGLAGIGSIAGALDNASDIRDLGYAQQNYLEGMGQDLADNTAFQGYGVSSGAGSPKGSVTIDPVTGGAVTDLGVGVNQAMMNNGQLNTQNALTGMGGMGGQSTVDYSGAAGTAIGNSLADPSQRQGEIFNQLMNMQNPMLDQQQAQQQAREHAMGRGGIMGSQFGGTAEDAAMAKARAQASNEAALGAMKQADAERTMFGQMGAAYGQLGNQAMQTSGDINSKLAQLGMDQQKMSYLPMEMQMKLMGLGQANSTMQQTGQLTGQDYLAQLGLGGVNANINAQKVSSELMGNLYNSVLSNLGGQSGSDGSGMSGIGGLLSSLGGGLDSIFGGLFD